MLFPMSEKCIFKVEHTETKSGSSVIKFLSYSHSGYSKTTLLKQKDVSMDNDAIEDTSSITCMIQTFLRCTRH